MSDLTTDTSETMRVPIEELLPGEFDPLPDQVHFLGGCEDDDNEDFDLFLCHWDVDNDLAVVASRDGRDEGDEDPYWVTYNEDVEDVNDDSLPVLREAKRRAGELGLLPARTPRDEISLDEDDEYRSKIDGTKDTHTKRNHSSEAVSLSGSEVDGKVYALYIVPRIDSKGPRTRESEARVYAVPATDSGSEMRPYAWWEDGGMPSHASTREAVRRAISQGFEFDVNEAFLNQRIEEDNACTSASDEPATEVSPMPAPNSETEKQLAQAISRILNGRLSEKTILEKMDDLRKKKNTEKQNNEITGVNMNVMTAKSKFTNVTVGESHDEQIHLPKGMTKAAARTWLTQIEQNEEQVIQWSCVIDAYPMDGALALSRVLERRFGNTVKSGATRQTWFGEVECPPFMISVEIGVDESAYVPWGNFTIPAMAEHKIDAGVSYKEKQLFFELSGDIKRKYKPLMDEIAEQVREELKTGSIYKGKVFRLKFPTDAEMAAEQYNPNDYAPRFIKPASNKDCLILSDVVQEQIDTNLFTLVEFTDMCRSHGIPLKRGVLLEGRYGTGKTLTASLLSKKCVENGWTFIYVANIADLEKAMRFAKRYEPAVIFAEDIDSVMKQKEGSERDKAMNDILNTIDGVDMKGAEQMVVLTSNFVDRINKAMLRPGRLDAVISVEPPDEKAVIKLLRHYAEGLLDKTSDADLMPAAELLAGQIPSVVREVVERSKLASVRRSALEGKKKATLKGDDLRISANGILTHINLLKDPPVDNRSDIEKAADRLGGHLKGMLGDVVNGKGKTLPEHKPAALPAAPVVEKSGN